MPHDKLAVAVCGCGTISPLMAQSYLKLNEKDDWNNAYIRAVIDPRKQIAEKKARIWSQHHVRNITPNDIEVYTSLEESSKEDSTIDLVEIVSPHHLHLEQTKRCFDADKHVSLQKVPAMTVKEMNEIVEIVDMARERGLKFHVFENFRHHPPYQKVKEILDTGVCGELESVYYNMVSSIGGGMFGEEYNYFEDGKLEIPLSAWKGRFTERETYRSPTTFDDGYHKHSMMNLWLDGVDSVRSWRGNYRILDMIDLDAPAVTQYKKENGKNGIWTTTAGQTIPMKSNYYSADEFLRVDCSDGIIISNGCTGNTFEGASEVGGVGEPGVYWLNQNGEWNSDCSMPTDWKYSFARCGRYFVDETINGSGNASLSAREARKVLKIGIAMINSARNDYQEIGVESATRVYGKQKDPVPWYLKPLWNKLL